MSFWRPLLMSVIWSIWFLCPYREVCFEVLGIHYIMQFFLLLEWSRVNCYISLDWKGIQEIFDSYWQHSACEEMFVVIVHGGAEEEGSRNQSSVKLTACIWKYHAEVVSLLPLFFSIFFFLRSLKLLIISSQKNKKL